MIPNVLNPKYVTLVISLVLFVWVTFFLYDRDHRGLTWAILSLGTFSLFLLAALELRSKRSWIQGGSFPYVALACIVGNIFYFRGESFERFDPMRQLSSNSLSAFLKANTKQEELNLLAGLHPYLHQNILVVNPDQLNLSGMPTGELIHYRIAREVKTTLFPITLTNAVAENMLTLPHVDWPRLDGGVYHLIEPRATNMTYFLAEHRTHWFLIPQRYCDGDLEGASNRQISCTAD